MRPLGTSLVLVVLLATVDFAQKPRKVAGGHRSELVNSDRRASVYAFESKLLNRKVSFGVLLPADYAGQASRTRVYPVVYLLHGLDGHYNNWFEKTSVKQLGDELIIVTPEGENGWYTDSSTVPNDRYESYIIQELIPEIDSRFRTIADWSGRAIAGLSMGGYGAVKFGLKHPEMFSLVGSFSGVFDAASRTEKTGNKWPSIPAVFGPEGSRTRAENYIFALVRDLPTEKIASLPFIYFDCGTEDTFYAINREFATLLVEKKVPHEFRELPGKHGWPYWDQQAQEFLRVAYKRMTRSTL
jgi:S-formylglutathione hydrolase FrmB